MRDTWMTDPDRLALLGPLAARVVHEINNPLAVVIASLEGMDPELAALDGSQPDPRTSVALRAQLQDARVAAERMRLLVRDLTVYLQPDHERRAPVDIARVIDAALLTVSRELLARARLVRDLAPTPPVDATESRLDQVFLHLLTNAAQAIPPGDPAAHEIRVTSRVEGGRVVVTVTDTGAGLAPEDLDRIFEPFYTTRAVGTGLGLSICRHILNGMGGDISAESALGRTTLRVSLPAGQLTAAPPAPSPAEARRCRILVVDDEPMMVRLLQKTLAQQHDVDGVVGGREALDRIQGGARYDAILCDLMMPRVSGIDVLRELERIAPEMADRILFLTGGAFTPEAQAFLDSMPNRYIEKPVSTPRLLELVRSLVG